MVLILILLYFTKLMYHNLLIQRWGVPVFWKINLIFKHE